MKIYDIEQNTDEWMQCRAGKFTASNFSKLFMAKTTAGYNNLINKVVFERITGQIPESFSNEWTERGKELEPEAIDEYEVLTFKKVKRVGFIEMNEFVGCSPDGLIGEKETLEIKCPKYSTLIDYHVTGKIIPDYYWQMQGGLYITERESCDFFCYHPNFKPLLRKVYRDEAKIKELQEKLNEAIELVQQRINKLKVYNG